MPKKVKIEKHLSESEIEELLKEYKPNFNMYRRLLLVYKVLNGLSIAKASEHLNVCSKTGETWVKNYNANGLEGLETKYKNCGRKSRMSDEDLEDLKNFIDNSEKSYDVADVKILIEERYGVDYSENYTWRLLREKLHYNYGKPYLKYQEQPENAEEDLKEKTKDIDLENEIVVVLDETKSQNKPNTSRQLYPQGKDNILKKSGKRFDINVTGIQAINSKPFMATHLKSNAFTFSKIICSYRKSVTKNKKAIKLIDNAINNENLTEEVIKEEIINNSTSKYQFFKKINNKEKNTNSLENAVTAVMKICKKEEITTKKIEYRKRTNLINNLNNDELKELMQKEPKINIVLDNARIHHAKMVKTIADILNINLIFLPPYSPNLSPIEDVWRKIKSKLKNINIKSREELSRHFKRIFYKIIYEESFYIEWVKKFFSENI